MIRIVSRFEYFFICEFIIINSKFNSKSETAFSKRFVFWFVMIDFTLFEEMKSYVKNLKIQFEFLISKRFYRDVIRLFYQYKHLNSIDLTDLSLTDFIIHKIKLISEIKFHSIEQRRWLLHKKWWLRKLISDKIRDDVYEKTDFWNDKFFSWNARAVLIDKMKNLISENESRMTYDYFHVIEELSDVHIQLMIECHDYFFDFRHECFMIANLKHVYFTIKIHSDDCEFFVFTISELKQLRSIRMQQKSMTIFFTMSELMCKTLKKIFENSKKSLFFQNYVFDLFSSLIFYQNNIMNEYFSFDDQFQFFKMHFFSRIEWTRLKLFFKKLFLFQNTIKILKFWHYVDEKIQILKNRVCKIVNFSILTDKTNVKTFFDTIDIIHRWISNFFEIEKLLIKFIEKIDWR